MMKKNSFFLLLTTTFYSIGAGVVGIFFPFLVMQSFDWSVTQILFWLSAVHVIILLLLWPLNYFLAKYCPQKIIMALGNMSYGLFFLVLGLDFSSIWQIIFATILYSFMIILYWPSFSAKSTQTTQESNRGKYWAYFQAIRAGANVIGPLVGGYFLANHWEHGLIWIAMTMFGIGTFFILNLKTENEKVLPLGSFLKFMRTTKFRKIRALLCENGIQAGVMIFVWPIFMKLQLQSFLDMGLLVSIAAVTEIVFSNFIGRQIDKKKREELPMKAVFARFFDFVSRMLLFFFPYFGTAALLLITGSFLGPVFQISYFSRTSRLSIEKSPVAPDLPKQSINFWIFREMLGMLGRSMVVFGAALGVYFGGESTLLIWLLVAGLASFGLRRF